jgi:hypothetical protein
VPELREATLEGNGGHGYLGVSRTEQFLRVLKSNKSGESHRCVSARLHEGPEQAALTNARRRHEVYDVDRRVPIGFNMFFGPADLVRRTGVSDRASFLAGSFFETIPAITDAIVLKSVIHDWDDARSSLILQNCRHALPVEGKLILVERIMPELPCVEDENRSHAMSDLNMLRGPGGLERTENEYHRLLTENGFRPMSISPAGRFSVIEARAR